MAYVESPNEVYLYGVHYPILRPVQESLVSPFGSRIVTGDPTRSDQTVVSEWNQGDWRGGLGVFDMDEQTQQDRFWFGTALGIFKKQLTLPFQAIDTGRGSLTTDQVISKFLEYNSAVYAAFGAYIKKWNDTTKNWDDERTLADAPTDAIVYNERPYWFTGDSYDYFDGAEWNRVDVPGQYACIYDNKLVSIDNSGQIRWTIDGENWTNNVKLPLQGGSYNDMITYWNNAGEPTIFVGTKEGVWSVDFWAQSAYQTAVQYAPNAKAGRLLVAKDGNLFVSDGLMIMRFTGNTVTNIGFDLDDGLPVDLRGNVVSFANTPNWPIVVFDASTVSADTTDWIYHGQFTGSEVVNTSSGFSAIIAWSGTGWHVLYLSSRINQGSRTALFTTSYGENRLWFGVDGVAKYIRMPEGVYNPLFDPFARYASDGYMETSWFDAKFSEAPKIAISLKVRCKNLGSAGEPDPNKHINVYYATDDSTAWQSLGTVRENGPTVLYFNTGGKRGLQFEKIRFRYELATTDSTTTPVLIYASLRYRIVPKTTRAWNFQIDVSQPYKGRSPSELIRCLSCASDSRYPDAASDEKTLGEFCFRSGDTEVETWTDWVVISGLNAQQWTGADEKAIYNITVVAA
jgi:hypothetical protein